jgi:hypothetical protein
MATAESGFIADPSRDPRLSAPTEEFPSGIVQRLSPRKYLLGRDDVEDLNGTAIAKVQTFFWKSKRYSL